MTYSEAKRAGLNPRYRKLQSDIQLAGGFYPRLKQGSRVLVTDAANQPDWEEEGKVFIEQPNCGCEILIKLNQGIVNP